MGIIELEWNARLRMKILELEKELKNTRDSGLNAIAGANNRSQSEITELKRKIEKQQEEMLSRMNSLLSDINQKVENYERLSKIVVLDDEHCLFVSLFIFRTSIWPQNNSLVDKILLSTSW